MQVGRVCCFTEGRVRHDRRRRGHPSSRRCTINSRATSLGAVPDAGGTGCERRLATTAPAPSRIDRRLSILVRPTQIDWQTGAPARRTEHQSPSDRSHCPARTRAETSEPRSPRTCSQLRSLDERRIPFRTYRPRALPIPVCRPPGLCRRPGVAPGPAAARGDPYDSSDDSQRSEASIYTDRTADMMMHRPIDPTSKRYHPTAVIASLDATRRTRGRCIELRCTDSACLHAPVGRCTDASADRTPDHRDQRLSGLNTRSELDIDQSIDIPRRSYSYPNPAS